MASATEEVAHLTREIEADMDAAISARVRVEEDLEGVWAKCGAGRRGSPATCHRQTLPI